MNFIFTDNRQIKNEFKKLTIDIGVTMSDIAKRCGLLPQQLNNQFNNSRIAFTDLQKYLNSIGYDLELNFVRQIATPEKSDQAESTGEVAQAKQEINLLPWELEALE